MMALFLVVFTVVSLGLVLSVGRFLSCLIILENFNVLILLLSLIMTSADSHMLFVVLMVVSTIEVVVGLILLTRLWEFGGRLDSVGA